MPLVSWSLDDHGIRQLDGTNETRRRIVAIDIAVEFDCELVLDQARAEAAMRGCLDRRPVHLTPGKREARRQTILRLRNAPSKSNAAGFIRQRTIF